MLFLFGAIALVAVSGRASGVGAEPRAIAERAVGAIAKNDAALLERVAHPELIRRMRSARLVTFYLGERNQSTDLTKSSDTDVVRLFCEAHKAMAPRDPQLEYLCDYLGTDVRGDYAIVTLASGWRSKSSTLPPPSNEEVILKKSAGEWRFLWSPIVNVHVDLEWDARTEIPGWAPPKRTAESSNSAYPITASDREFLAQVLRAVQSKDAAWIANHTFYPVTIRTSREQHTIDSPQAFAAILSSELTPELAQKLSAAAAQPLFSNWRGIMVGRGVLWFGSFGSTEKGPPWRHYILSIGGFAFQATDEIVDDTQGNASLPSR